MSIEIYFGKSFSIAEGLFFLRCHMRHGAKGAQLFDAYLTVDQSTVALPWRSGL
jgi:hypothetical protein